MKKLFLFPMLVGSFFLSFLSSCKKEDIETKTMPNNETALQAEADQAITMKKNETESFTKEWEGFIQSQRSDKNITQLAISLPIFKSLVAAVVKTGLAETLATPGLNATVFAPTDAAFAKLPAPFNNPANISAITDQSQINALRNILLYHVLGAQVLRNQVAPGRSSATTLKPAGSANDNTIYFSNSFGVLLVNGKSLVLLPNVMANNGVIHVIDDVLLPPSQNIAEIAIGDPAFSSLVAALVKTNLAAVFTGAGNFTVFAPTDAAFAQLPAPFNNAANINAINDPAQISALANILKYHVASSRYFAWDLGFFRPLTTLADEPSNKLTGLLGFNTGYVKGNQNPAYSRIQPANILAVNGVIQVIDRVLLP
jgi:uncharacterized surface protein with fasciclin (FAS1) repeats